MRLVLWHFERKSKKNVWHFFKYFFGFWFFRLVCILCSIVPGTISAVLDPREEVSSNPYCGWWHGGIWCGWTSVHPFLPDPCFGICVVLVPCFFILPDLENSDNNKISYFFVSFQTGRMGKKEGFNNKQKKVCHDVWVKDKVDRRPLGVWEVEDLLYTGVVLFKTVFAFLASRAPSLQLKHGDLRLGWFIHENVLKFPGEYLEDTFKPLGYGNQSTVVSPQRFGKPMNRPAWWKSVIWF